MRKSWTILFALVVLLALVGGSPAVADTLVLDVDSDGATVDWSVALPFAGATVIGRMVAGLVTV